MMVLRWSFALTRKGLEDVFKEVLGTSSGRRLGDALKKGRRDFHFRPIYDVFETKIKTFLRRLCDVILSAGKVLCSDRFCILLMSLVYEADETLQEYFQSLIH